MYSSLCEKWKEHFCASCAVRTYMKTNDYTGQFSLKKHYNFQMIIKTLRHSHVKSKHLDSARLCARLNEDLLLLNPPNSWIDALHLKLTESLSNQQE